MDLCILGICLDLGRISGVFVGHFSFVLLRWMMLWEALSRTEACVQLDLIHCC